MRRQRAPPTHRMTDILLRRAGSIGSFNSHDLKVRDQESEYFPWLIDVSGPEGNLAHRQKNCRAPFLALTLLSTTG